MIMVRSSSATEERDPSDSTKFQSTHRLPTVSAKDALLQLQNANSEHVVSGLNALDELLCEERSGPRSYQPGKIIEIWGPPGSGKTALMLQIARNTLLAGNSVLWIDTTLPVSSVRLHDLFNSGIQNIGTPLKGFRHIRIKSLAQLLALLSRRTHDFPTKGTALVVIDGFHSLLDLVYPRFLPTNGLIGETVKWQAGRRYALLGTVINSLNQLSTLQNFVALVSTGSASRMRSEAGIGAGLVPGVGGPEWEAGIWSRLCMFRDFARCYIGIQKCQGKGWVLRNEVSECGRLVPFYFGPNGELLGAIENMQTNDSDTYTRPIPSRKRTFDEIADSEGEAEDEEYAWLEADDTLFVDEQQIAKEDNSQVE